jgi:nondiscriminating glutamyl-tRNA synthetase
MAFLGWNPGTEREVFPLNSLIKEFSLDRVQKSGAVFNIKRLNFLNKFYIRQKPIDKLTELCIPYLIKDELIAPLAEVKEIKPTYGGEGDRQQYKALATGEMLSVVEIQKIISLYQERLERLAEISGLVDFFFKQEVNYDRGLLKWNNITDKELSSSLDISEKILHKIKEGEFTRAKLEEVLLKEAEKFGKKINRAGDRGFLLWPLRVSLTGKKASASPFEIGEILGKEKVLRRIKKAKEILK